MNRTLRTSTLLSLVMLLTLIACQATPVPTATPLATETSLLTLTLTPTEVLTATPAATATPLRSTMVLGIDSTTIKTIYNQAQREAVARGIPYFFWPDSNIAFLPDGNQYRFFAPNGPRTAITLGTFDDPGQSWWLPSWRLRASMSANFPSLPAARSIVTRRAGCC